MIMRSFCKGVGAILPVYVICVPAEEAMGVEAGAGGREDIQEGMDGGGRVTQVQNKIYKILGQQRKHTV